MTAALLVDRVAGVIAKIAGPERTPPAAGSETPLAGGGFWLDSVALLEAIVSCETEFGVSFDPDLDLTPEALATVGSLASLVEGKLDPKHGA